MALLKQKASNNETFFDVCDGPPSPEGQYVATCTAIVDASDVERTDFQGNPEVLDVTRFLFQYEHNGETVHVQTREMRQSADNRSNLYKFLSSWLGDAPVVDGSWDYQEMMGQQALIKVAHQVSNRSGNTYAIIENIMPVPAQMQSLGQAFSPTPAPSDPGPGQFATTASASGSASDKDLF